MHIGEKLRELTSHQRILDFCAFAFADVSDGELPDYEALDLMQVPRLVPNVFVHDYRNGTDKGLFIKFSGTRIDEHYGRVVQGHYFQDTYVGDDKHDRYIPLHYEAIAKKKPFFAQRSVRYESDEFETKFRLSTALYVPCSSDQVTVNYAIGIVFFECQSYQGETIYVIIGDD